MNGWRDEIAKYEADGKRITAYVGNKFRSLFISEQARVWMRNLRSGRLDTKKLWNDDSESIFRKKTEGRREDAAVSLIIDNSGSMYVNGSNKYLIASSLLVSLANELDRVRVPFECVGFTSNSNEDYAKNNLGIRTAPIHLNVIKMFNESYRRSKYRFVWPPRNSMTVELDCLKYAVNRLLQRKETKKAIFVLCDGQIDSSSRTLNDSLARAQKEYVKRLEKAGIFVVGFGIKDSSVADYYSNHIIVNDLDEFARKFFKELSHILFNPPR
jgi:cobalamin biosynthesis protein CobT